MHTQTMDGRYVDREKLVKLLKDLFGAGNFQIKAIDDNYKVSAPRALSQAEQAQVKPN